MSLQTYIIGAHVVYIAAWLGVRSRWEDWSPLQQTQQKPSIDGSTSSNSSARRIDSSSSPSSTPRSPPFLHLHSRPGCILHLLVLALSLFACLHVTPQASEDLERSGLMRPSSDGGRWWFQRPPMQPTSTRRCSHPSTHVHVPAPGDAADLVPRQRGGKRSVQDILESDVAHLLPKKPSSNQQAGPESGECIDEGTSTLPSDSSFSSTRNHPFRGSALVSIIFHILSLLFTFTHSILYSPWSHIDPRRPPPSAASSIIRPRLRQLFQATSCIAYLMLTAIMISIGALFRVQSDTGGDNGSDDSSGSFNSVAGGPGLVASLLYLPFLLFHGYRFAANVVFMARFHSIFPRAAPKRADKANRAKKQDKDSHANATAQQQQQEGSDSDSDSNSAGTKLTQRKRGRQRKPSSNESQESLDEDALAALDMTPISEIAAFADGHPSASSSSSSTSTTSSSVSLSDLDSLQPSRLIQRLRGTPAVLQLFEQEQMDRIKQIRRRKEKTQNRDQGESTEHHSDGDAHHYPRARSLPKED